MSKIWWNGAKCSSIATKHHMGSSRPCSCILCYLNQIKNLIELIKRWKQRVQWSWSSPTFSFQSMHLSSPFWRLFQIRSNLFVWMEWSKRTFFSAQIITSKPRPSLIQISKIIAKRAQQSIDLFCAEWEREREQEEVPQMVTKFSQHQQHYQQAMQTESKW